MAEQKHKSLAFFHQVTEQYLQSECGAIVEKQTGHLFSEISNKDPDSKEGSSPMKDSTGQE